MEPRTWWWRRAKKWAGAQKTALNKAAAWAGIAVSVAMWSIPLAAWYAGAWLGKRQRWTEKTAYVFIGIAGALTLAVGIFHEPILTSFASIGLGAAAAPNNFVFWTNTLFAWVFVMGAAVSCGREHSATLFGQADSGRGGAFLASKRRHLERIIPGHRFLPWTRHLRGAPDQPPLGFPDLRWKPGKESVYDRVEQKREKALHREQREAARKGLPAPTKPQHLSLGRQEEIAKYAQSLLRGRPTVTTETEGSVLIIGAEGSGKSGGLLIPTILSPAYDNANVVVASIKNELVDLTIGHRATCGEVTIYDPTAGTGLESARWSIIDTASTWDAAQRVAGALLSQSGLGEGVKDSSFFTNVAEGPFAALLLAANTASQPLSKLLEWVDNPDKVSGPGGKVAAILEHDEDDDSAPEGWGVAISKWHGLMEKEPRARGRELDTIQAALKAFTATQVMRSADTSTGQTFRPRQFLEGSGNTHYLAASSLDQKLYAPVFIAHLREIIKEAIDKATAQGGALKTKLVIILDEAANIAPLPGLADLLSQARGYNITVWTAFQDHSQIEKTYPGAAGTIWQNSRTRIVGSASIDRATLDYVAANSGQRITETVSETQRVGGLTAKKETEQHGQAHETLLPADVVRQLGRGSAIHVHQNLPFTVIDLNFWFNDPFLRGRALMGRSAKDILGEAKPQPGQTASGLSAEEEQRINRSWQIAAERKTLIEDIKQGRRPEPVRPVPRRGAPLPTLERQTEVDALAGVLAGEEDGSQLALDFDDGAPEDDEYDDSDFGYLDYPFDSSVGAG